MKNKTVDTFYLNTLSLLWAIGLALIWATILIFSLTHSIGFAAPIQVMVLCFLYTGLFIQAHDGMHGLILPARPYLNHFIAGVLVFSYACLPYRKLFKKHQQHHQHPGKVGDDPDFHRGDERFLSWYFSFMRHYTSLEQIIGLFVIFWVLRLGLQLPLENILLFWALPSLLSSLQLFYFGTYLPHRRKKEGEDDFDVHHHTRSHRLNLFLSFISCYHFGLHREHHRYPHLRWWQLPSVRGE